MIHITSLFQRMSNYYCLEGEKFVFIPIIIPKHISEKNAEFLNING
jgi:hypothetical protein